MPEQTIYFQWQNDVLRKTIYPLREMKLRDFLVYYKEIELWAEYKNKDIKGEINAYHAQKKLAVEKAAKAYFEYRNYFMSGDVRADYMKKFGAVDEEILNAIHAFHRNFSTYLPKFTDPRRETYFVSQQVLFWQQYRKEYLKKLANKQRRVDIMKSQTPPHPNAPKEEQELIRMQKPAFQMVDEELNRLYVFVSTSGRIEKRKQDIEKSIQNAEKIVKEATAKLDLLKPQIEKQNSLQKKASDELARLKSPPQLASVESYFSTADVSSQLRNQFAQASQSLVDAINKFHKDLKDQFSYSKSESSRLNVIRNTLYSLNQYQATLQKEIIKHDTDLRNMGPTWKYKAEREALRDNLRNVSLKAVEEELKKLTDFQAAFEYSSKSKDEMTKLVQAKELELASANGSLSKLRDEAKALQSQIDSYDDILIVTEEKRLMEYVPDASKPVTVKDIVQVKLDDYKLSLGDLDHYQLLELVVKEFKAKLGRYPRWLQYMVVHFSGMRYASAHGSWADPKDLLANLHTAEIEKEMKSLSEDAVEALCREKVESYEPSSGVPASPVQQKPKLAQATDPEWKERIAGHLKRIKRALEIDSPSHQRNSLINLRIDEGSYEVDAMKSDEIYEALMDYKDDLPDWMWKEIVKLTDLRLTEVKDKDWEKSTQGQTGGFSKQDAEFRQMMGDWKNKFMTGWREEHDRSDRLVVSRAVCNEVAEHIQHLRGHTPPGGLTPKPTWYQSNEKKDPNSYLVKPESETDFKTGASILWLRFVRKEPNEWQMAHPITTKKGGFGLLPPGFIAKRATSGPNETTPWAYNMSDPITRVRTFLTAEKARIREQEWLRWIHEATVVEMADTADGKIVLTFETALPSDDPRLSSIGVFKHRLSDLLLDGEEDVYNRSFIGYIPEGKVPEDNLKDMLDWDKVLLKQ
ncbi:MAG: hypothetical protein IPP66_10900 [Anaerolineales bacterium]|nr:hypothetical protein [Anaerolineales bacterium]